MPARRTEPYEPGRDSPVTSYRLIVIAAPPPGREGTTIALGEATTLGREDLPEVTYVIDDAKLSRKHARLHRAGSTFEIADLGSLNGTFVNRERIDRRRLEDGDVIRIGETVLLFDAGSAEPAQDGGPLVGAAGCMRALLDEIERVAPSGLSVLVTGETGAGKELVSRRLHEASGRTGPFVAVNCASIPPTLAEASFFGHKKGAYTDAVTDGLGFFAAAEGGTLFLDEIGALGLELQPKLLRVLENRELTPVGATTARRTNVRVVAATNADLAAEADSGSFRRDLFARLAEYTLHVPPLRERRADIMPLVRHFLAQAAPGRAFTLSAAFVEAVLAHPWPMNVRELRSLATRLSLTLSGRDSLGIDDLPERMRAAEPPATASMPSKEELEALLARHGGSVTHVARHYQRARAQVYRWIDKLGIELGKFKA